MNDYNNAMSQAGHRLELIGRERLTVSGVEDVERFDETGIIMSTSVGTLVYRRGACTSAAVPGRGELHVDGRIDSVSYEDGGQERGGLFHRAVRVRRHGPCSLPAAPALLSGDPAGHGCGAAV